MAKMKRSPKGFGSVIKMKGNRRLPYMVRIQTGDKINHKTGKVTPIYYIVGYAKNRKEGLMMLAEYHRKPFNLKYADLTFADVYHDTMAYKERKQKISKSSKTSYRTAFQACSPLHGVPFVKLKTKDLQEIIDNCNKNYPSLKNIKILYSQMYKYAIKHEICNTDYSKNVDLIEFTDKNPNAKEHKRFTTEEISELWKYQDDRYYQIILILIYTGLRISELLNLKKDDIYIKEQYFEVTKSKTKSGIRVVPIADKILPFFEEWMEYSQIDYLLCTEDQKPFKYRNYYDSYFIPIMDNRRFDHRPHDTRHTCASLMAEAMIDERIVKKILGHAHNMSLTEKVYTHYEIKTLVDAINQI